MHKIDSRSVKAKPRKVIDKRQQEVLIEFNDEEIEWVDEDSVDLSNVVLVPSVDADLLPIYTIDQLSLTPWM